jgi:hypothetical protein
MAQSALLTRYRVDLTHNATTQTIYPTQDDIGVQFVEESGQEFLRRRIKDGLLLTGADYAYVLAIENGADRCLPITIEVINLATDVLEFFATSYLANAAFDLSKCNIKLKVESHDQYTTLFNLWEKPVNLLDDTDTVCTFGNFATLATDPLTEFEDLTTTEVIDVPLPTFPAGIHTGGPDDFSNSGWPDLDLGWKIVYDDITLIEFATGVLDWEATRVTSFRREITTGTYSSAADLPGNTLGSWFPEGTTPCKFFRQVDAQLITGLSTENTTFIGSVFPNVWYFNTHHKEYRWIPGDTRCEDGFCNGLLLGTVFDKFLDGSGLTVKSNIFNINPSGASPANDLYTDEKYFNLVVYQVTDIKLPDATEPATVLEKPLKDFLEILYKMFQVKATMNGSELVVEHVSFYDDVAVGIDLVTDYPLAIRGKEQYTYKNEVPPKAEDFLHDSEEQSQRIFKRWGFSYEIPAGSPVPSNCTAAYGPTAETIASGACNDIQAIFANSDGFSDDLIVFVNCFEYSGQLMIDGMGEYSLGTLNTQMSPYYLREFWYYRRWFYYGQKQLKASVQYFTFFSVLLSKEQTELEIPLRDLTALDDLLKVTTTLGTGRVTQAEYSFKTGRLKLRPIFEAS